MSRPSLRQSHLPLFFLSGTNITTPPQFIHFITVYINAGACAALTSPGRQWQGGASTSQCQPPHAAGWFSFHIINPTALSSTFIYSPSTQLGKFVVLAHAHGLKRRQKPHCCSRNPFPPRIPSSGSPVLPLKAGAYFIA